MRKSVFVLVIAAVFLIFISYSVRGNVPLITDEMIRQTLGNSREVEDAHEIMTRETRQLKGILDGFLSGDLEKIEEKAGLMTEAMQTIAQKFPIESKAQPSAWKAMSEIVNQSSLLQVAAQQKNYKKAYDHYVLLVNQCVQCHQVTREWGKLPDLKSKAEIDSKKSQETEDVKDENGEAESEEK